MLEANRVQLQTGLVEFKGSSNKLIRTFTWNRSTSSRSSSCKSLVTSSSKSSFTWTESKNDLLDDYGGMESGSHSSILGRLYVWEKKLYEEAKAVSRQKRGQFQDAVARQKYGQFQDAEAVSKPFGYFSSNGSSTMDNCGAMAPRSPTNLSFQKQAIKVDSRTQTQIPSLVHMESVSLSTRLVEL